MKHIITFNESMINDHSKTNSSTRKNLYEQDEKDEIIWEDLLTDMGFG